MKQISNFDDESQNLPDFLKDQKLRGGGFRVPENYFDTLENEVFKNLEAIGARRKPAPEPGFFDRLNAWLSSIWGQKFAYAFAGVLALGLAAWWVFAPRNALPAQVAQVEISEEDAENFVLENLPDFDPNSLAPESAESSPHFLNDSTGGAIQFSTDDVEDLLDELSEDELKELL